MALRVARQALAQAEGEVAQETLQELVTRLNEAEALEGYQVWLERVAVGALLEPEYPEGEDWGAMDAKRGEWRMGNREWGKESLG
jgi:hypothetical protein